MEVFSEHKGGFKVDDGLSFSLFYFTSFHPLPYFLVHKSTITHLDDVYDKMGRRRLKKLLFLAVLY